MSKCTSLWIKGSRFNLQNLLADESLGDEFNEGSIAICRLAPQGTALILNKDYHRFHFPINGKIEDVRRIEGTYFTVNSMVVRTSVDIYTENLRTVTTINSQEFGKVLFVAVGAMFVGSIVFTKENGQFKRYYNFSYNRMDEHGYFAFGGSTIILLFQAGRIAFDKDLMDNSEKCFETIIQVGSSIGQKI